MFSGWSTVVSAPPVSGGGSGWSTGSGTGGTTSGGGWSTGPTQTAPSGGGGSWTFGSGSSDTGSAGGGFSYAAPVQSYSSYSYQSGNNTYSLPGAGLYAFPAGEQGPYTPIDFPLMHELAPGERLDDLNAQSGNAGGSVLPYLALGVILAVLLKG